MLKVFTEDDTKKIQIDEGIVAINLGEPSQRILGPTRGGAEVTITPVIRDIDFDGRRGKTMGMQVKDEEDATVKVTSLCCKQEDLLYALPNAVMDENTKVITQGDFGPIKSSSYLKTIDVITQMLDGTFKVLTFNYGLHEGAFTYNAKPKAENEHNLEFIPHYTIEDASRLFKITDHATNPLPTNDNGTDENPDENNENGE